MNTNKAIALLGFLPDTELRLKKLIVQHLSNNVDWVTATDQSLQGVVINADFISSPQIQNYIKRTAANIVCCYNDQDGQQQAKKNEIQSLNLLRHNASELQTWLSKLSGEELIVDPSTVLVSNEVVQPVQKEPSFVSSSSAPKTQNINRPISNASNHPSKTNDDESETLSLSNDYKKLLSLLSLSKGYYIVRYGEKNVWVNSQKNETYLDFDRDKIEGIENSGWATLSELNPPPKARKLQLDLWLFETVWQSSMDFSEHFSNDDLFKLTRWPRPLCSHGRSEALRLAAFIQSAAATTSLLSNKTGYGKAMVLRFVYAGLQAGQIQRRGNATSADMARENEKGDVDQKKLSLLKRLRGKLGL